MSGARRWHGALLALCLGAMGAACAQAPATGGGESVQSIEVGRGARESFYLSLPVTPARASVVLLAGGDGVVRVVDPPPAPGEHGNFLVRTRRMFARQGFVVATPDVPSDHAQGIDGRFRSSAAQADDLLALVRWLKARYALPVWLVGTSRGTVSAANAAVRLGPRIDGLVLSSSITRVSRRDAYTVRRLDLASIRVPTLLLAQAEDSCALTPPGDAPALLEALGSRDKQILILSGGAPPRSGPCEALAHHGFIGQERQAVERIARFIAARAP